MSNSKFDLTTRNNFKKYKKSKKVFDDYEDDGYNDDRRHAVNKHKQRRINHALRTKNIDELLDAEDEIV